MNSELAHTRGLPILACFSNNGQERKYESQKFMSYVGYIRDSKVWPDTLGMFPRYDCALILQEDLHIWPHRLPYQILAEFALIHDTLRQSVLHPVLVSL